MRGATNFDSIAHRFILLLAVLIIFKLCLINKVDNFFKYVIDFDVFACASLEVEYIILGGKLVRFILTDLAIICQVALSADQKNHSFLFTVVLNRKEPSADGVVCLALRDVKAYHHSVTLLIKIHCQRLESLLSCSIPDLKIVLVPRIRLRMDIKIEIVKAKTGQVSIRECLVLECV